VYGNNAVTSAVLCVRYGWRQRSSALSVKWSATRNVWRDASWQQVAVVRGEQTGSLGPHKFALQTACHWFSCFCTAHPCAQYTGTQPSVRASVTKQYDLMLFSRWWCTKAKKVTVDLASYLAFVTPHFTGLWMRWVPSYKVFVWSMAYLPLLFIVPPALWQVGIEQYRNPSVCPMLIAQKRFILGL